MISRIIPNFPEPYKRELFYHTIARAMDQMHGLSSKNKTIALFGCFRKPRVAIPNHIYLLSERLGNIFDPAEIIQNHSVYPYYNLFLPKYRQENFENTVLTFKEDPSRFYLGKSNQLSLKSLRYCPSCLEKDKLAGRTLYPRVEWQLPGIDICPFDYSYLRDYPLLEKEDINNEYLSIKESRLSFESTVCQDNDLINIAHLALELFDYPISILNRKDIYAKIFTLLKVNGYFKDDDLKYLEFYQDLKEYYSDEIREKLPPESIAWFDRMIFYNTWLGRIIFKSPVPTIPFYWLLVINFFCDSMDEFLNIEDL